MSLNALNGQHLRVIWVRFASICHFKNNLLLIFFKFVGQISLGGKETQKDFRARLKVALSLIAWQPASNSGICFLLFSGRK
jgi:hypothetical protein